jgi:RNA polymerase sigma-70 factor (ECF subfamily)
MNDSAEQLYERVLVIRCRAGDQNGFTELVACYQPRLRYYLRQIIPESHTIEDILQEVWLDVFRGISGLMEVSAFRGWLYRIARFRALGELRKRKPLNQLMDEADVIDEGDYEASVSAENAEQIHAALQELAAEHCEVLVLRFLEDMSYEEMASVTGCPIGTVRSRIYYAKQALRRVLERMSCHE